ncbi:MAG: transposase [Candidatus Sulfotelmatobacter sp.]
MLTEIRALGYSGCYSSLAKFLAGWRDHELELKRKSRPPASVSLRQQPGTHPTLSGQISPLVAAALLSKPGHLLTGWQAAKVEALKKVCPDFARMRSLVMSFRGILQAGKIATLARWMKKAVGSGIYGMKRFVRKLNQDLAAVKNALSEGWSNGPVEGHINRLKTLKRQMYGRAGFELLRARLMPMSRGSPLPEIEEEPLIIAVGENLALALERQTGPDAGSLELALFFRQKEPPTPGRGMAANPKKHCIFSGLN